LSNNDTNDGNRNDVLDSVSVAAFDVDARIFRTLWHSMLKPADVALAGMQADYSIYLSPVRVFVAMFSIQFAIAALFGAPTALTIELLGVDPDVVDRWRGEFELIDINRELHAWLVPLMWPMTVVFSLPYLVVLKLNRPSLSWWGHASVFLVATNASYVLAILVMPTAMLGVNLYSALSFLAVLVFFIVMGRLIAKLYAKTAMGVALRMTGLLALLPITFLLTVIGQFIITFLVLDAQFDLLLLDLFSPPQPDIGTTP
jgi:hypothetical protein